MKRIRLFLLALAGTVQAAPNVLFTPVNDPAGPTIAQAVNAGLGSGHVDVDIFIDKDSGAPQPSHAITNSNNAGATFQSVASGLNVNHQPYTIINWSATGLNGTPDSLFYSQLNSLGAVLTIANGRGSTIRHGVQGGTVQTSSQNSGDGSSGWGVEFGLSTTYNGINTNSDSVASAEMAGYIAALKFNHSTWNYWDIRGALRQTAANWVTGYDHTKFGYGYINWINANAVSAPSAVYLQGPNLVITNNGYYAMITLYPFRQTRRTVEAVYSVSASYVWPVKNEYTAADITASGATLLYTSNGTDVAPTFSYAPAVSGTVTFVAFTTDGSSNYSRVEEYSAQSMTFTVSGSCNK